MASLVEAESGCKTRPVFLKTRSPPVQRVHLDTVLTARPGSAGWQPAVSPIGKRQRSAPARPLPLAWSTPCGLKIRDTADCKSALLQEPWPEAPVSLQTRRFSHGYHPNPTLSPCAWTKSTRA